MHHGTSDSLHSQQQVLEDGLYRGLMRRGAGDELAAGCAKSQMFHDASQATM